MRTVNRMHHVTNLASRVPVPYATARQVKIAVPASRAPPTSLRRREPQQKRPIPRKH